MGHEGRDNVISTINAQSSSSVSLLHKITNRQRKSQSTNLIIISNVNNAHSLTEPFSGFLEHCQSWGLFDNLAAENLNPSSCLVLTRASRMPLPEMLHMAVTCQRFTWCQTMKLSCFKVYSHRSYEINVYIEWKTCIVRVVKSRSGNIRLCD